MLGILCLQRPVLAPRLGRVASTDVERWDGMGRDGEADIRAQLAESARTFVVLLRRGSVRTSDAAVNQIVDHAYGSAERLRDALDLLGEDEQEPRALLTRAVRYAEDPRTPEPARVRQRPDASRFGQPHPPPATDPG